MALNGAEGIAAMGIDTPLSVLSHKNISRCFSYFKQLFRPGDQSANRCDPGGGSNLYDHLYRERRAIFWRSRTENCKVLQVNNPILTNTDLLKIKNMKVDGFCVARSSADYLL